MRKYKPLEFVEKTYLRVEDLKLVSGKTSRKHYLIPDQILITKTEKRVRTGTNVQLGKSTNLPKLYYYAAILLRNEIMGCVGKATDRQAILLAMRKEYPGWAKRTSENYIRKFGEFRNKYNTGRMYKGHTTPPLYCWFWDANGYIQHPQSKQQLLSFQFCLRHLKGAKFADPRFFTLEEISAITNNQTDNRDMDWHVPSISHIQQIEAEIKKPLYNSIEFPSGYGKEYDPI